MSKPRVAVVGIGRLGSFHTNLVIAGDLFDLVAIVEPVEAARHVATKEFSVRGVANISEIVEAIDCAIIATPTIYHFEVAQELLKAGKHLLIEKPITLELAQANDLIALAEAKELILQVGHVERFNPAFSAVASHVSTPLFIDAVRTTNYSFRSTDIGVTLDLMIHDIDLVLSLVDSPIAAIDAVGSVVIGPHEDIANARLTFENGTFANLTASRVNSEPQRTMRIEGPQGSTKIDFETPTAYTIDVSTQTESLQIDLPNTSEELKDLQARFFVDYLPKTEIDIPDGNALAMEQEDFAAAITNGEAVQVSGRDGRDALAVAIEIANQIRSKHQASPHAIKGPHFATDTAKSQV
ncbi:MAG: Gfo/Idh/MocA family oxidoreductase [Pirellulaceae bacterium]|nr:Gfo/Idh/MocA family oxidoreductase [Pirellulaceae bacterium]